VSSSGIKIFVVCHKPAVVPDNKLLYPIQVGSALAKNRLPGMLHDDEGTDNISAKNKSYCELTAHYYAWKNCDAEYYGFFHYRRYFSFNPELISNDGWGNIAFDNLNNSVAEQIHLNEEDMEKTIRRYDYITVKGRKIQTSIYDEYGIADFQNRSDLDTALEILKEKFPQYQNAAAAYMNSNIAYECNMFIAKKDIFNQYCEMVFGVLEECEKRIDTTWYGQQEYRVFGYLAERLTGIFSYYLINETNKKVGFLEKTLFKDTEPEDQTIEPVFANAVPIVLAANEGFAPYLDVMIRSVILNASRDRNYDIIVLNHDITEKTERLIQSFYSYNDNFRIRFVNVSRFFDSKKYFLDQHLSIETYYRLIIPELMPNYHKILYLDCDMVANDDVAKLYDIDLQGMVIGAAKDIDVAGQMKLGYDQWSNYATNTLNLDCCFDYFQAGVLIFDLDRLREITSSNEMMDLASGHKFRCHDQDVLNIICKNRVYYLPQEWNTLMSWSEPDGRCRMDILKMAYRTIYEEYLEARKHPRMVHFAGYQKPWQVGDCDFSDYFWFYAKESPFYPYLVRSIWRFNRSDLHTPQANAYVGPIGKLKKKSSKILPYGSKRRSFFRKIYYAIRNTFKR